MSGGTRSGFEDGLRLLARTRAGDGTACTELVGRYQERILQRIRLMMGPEARRTAESSDFLQGALLEVLQCGDDALPASEEAFLRWVTAIARNNIRDELRREHERSLESISQLLADCQDDSRGGPPARVEREERIQLLVQALEGLAPEQREVLQLLDLEGQALGEVAERLGRSRDAVRMLRTRALVRLGERLAEG
jgi:RNA polymerase sigma-70 factor (ECF subfamily)